MRRRRRNIRRARSACHTGHFGREMRVDGPDEEIGIRARFPEGGRHPSRFDGPRAGSGNGPAPLSNFVTLTPVAGIGQMARFDPPGELTPAERDSACMQQKERKSEEFGAVSLHPSPERIDKLTIVRQDEDLPGVYQVGIVDLIPVCLKDVDVKSAKSVLLP